MARNTYDLGLCELIRQFSKPYENVLPNSPSEISWIGSVQTWLLKFTVVFSGRMLDAGFFRSTFFAGAVLQIMGSLTLSVSIQNY